MFPVAHAHSLELLLYTDYPNGVESVSRVISFCGLGCPPRTSAQPNSCSTKLYPDEVARYEAGGMPETKARCGPKHITTEDETSVVGAVDSPGLPDGSVPSHTKSSDGAPPPSFVGTDASAGSRRRRPRPSQTQPAVDPLQQGIIPFLAWRSARSCGSCWKHVRDGLGSLLIALAWTCLLSHCWTLRV